jgi:hypothetical protein
VISTGEKTVTDISLQNLRPKNATAAGYREALALLRDERAAAQHRIAEEAERRPGLLLSGTVIQLRAAETAVRDDELNLQRLAALEVELSRKLNEATIEEAAAAHGLKVRAAIEAVEAFNLWFRSDYEVHARAIAAGVEMEDAAWRAREALRDQATRAMPDLPEMARAYVGRDGRGLGFLTRLPGTEPGPGIVWPR